MKLYLFPHAPYSRKVLLAVYEKGIEIQKETVSPDDKAARQTLKAFYPIFTLPLLVLSDGTPLPESSIIIEHLELTSPAEPRLLPTYPMDALRVRAFDRLGDQLLAATAYLAFALGKPTEKQNAERIAVNKKVVHAALGLLDHALQERTFLHGEGLSLADLGPACAVASLLSDRSLESVKAWAGVERWFAGITARPTWQRIVSDCLAVPPPPGLRRR